MDASQPSKTSKAFTLIELLVVIAIIGILSSVVLASLSGARESARDTQRIQAVNQIRTALEMYYNDKGYYPGNAQTSAAYNFTDLNPGNYGPCGYDSGWCNLEDELSPYIDSLPRAKTFNEEFLYKIRNDGLYGLGVRLENPTEVSKNDGGYYSSRYETGPLPSYCMSEYTGTDRRWWSWSGYNCHSGD